jgi:hypothetical protein
MTARAGKRVGQKLGARRHIDAWRAAARQGKDISVSASIIIMWWDNNNNGGMGNNNEIRRRKASQPAGISKRAKTIKGKKAAKICRK